ncbi:hypothetical protein ACQY0O_007291 [Thecaphora frezii]|uniref:chitin deacetylase n=1 Tax=Thecaphora frezii TaxID=1269715 RepID=A0A8T9MZZ9_9BASI|nr:putative chitin deacetylase 4 [Thecaphora frezii]
MRISTIALGALALAAPLATAKAHGNHKAHTGVTPVKRQLPALSKNGLPYPEAGAKPPPKSSLPKEWIDRYNEKKAAGLIPDFAPSITDGDAITGYPASVDRSKVCSWTLDKCDTGDIWLAPPNKVAVTFDDGPTTESPKLIKYLESEKQGATHFLIGSAIVWNPEIINDYMNADPPMHLGVHTWSHTLQSSKTDLEILGDLGWTMQIIYDLTGKVPMYWRAPEGDVDARVRAIAKEVLGLQSVMWNRDADDWCLRQGTGTAQLDICTTGVGANKASVVREMTGWAKTTNKTGFISLEHETTDQAIDAFKQYHAALKQNNWEAGAVPELQGLPYYQNQWNLTTKAEEVTSILPSRKPIDVDHSDAPRGSAEAPDTSAFGDLDGSGQKATSASKSGSSHSSTSSSASSGKTTTNSASSSSQATKGQSQSSVSASGAAQKGAMLSSVGLASIAALVALVL